MGSWSSILLIFRQLCGEVWTRALSCVEALSGGELSTAARASLALGMGEQHCSAWAPALALCDSELAELAPGSLTFNAALMACQAGCNFELGLGLLERITRMSAQPHLLSTVSTSTVSFNILLGLCAREQLWEEALGLLGTMASQKVPRNEATFTSALQACEACEADRGQWSQWQRALSWFRDMMEIEPIEPTTIGFTALITTCGNAVQWQWALETFSEIRRVSLVPDVVSSTAALSACEKGCEWQRALVLFQAAMQLPGADVLVVNTAISAMDKASQWTLALAVMKDLEDRECVSNVSLMPDEFTLSAVISACSRGAEWQRALALLSELPERILQASSVAFNSAISACDRGSQWLRALKLLEEMLWLSLPADEISFNTAISACEKGELQG